VGFESGQISGKKMIPKDFHQEKIPICFECSCDRRFRRAVGMAGPQDNRSVFLRKSSSSPDSALPGSNIINICLNTSAIFLKSFYLGDVFSGIFQVCFLICP
jgi:hypothetical protein